jgi:hypothetical protein
VVLHVCVHACPFRKPILGLMARWIANMAGARFHSTHLAIREFSSLFKFSIPSHWLVVQRSERSRRGLWRVKHDAIVLGRHKALCSVVCVSFLGDLSLV